MRRTGSVEVSAYWKHWIHLFPQHGAGVKHDRPIRLEGWQRELVTRYPKDFLAGLIHSDGCRSINTVKRTPARASLVRYAYPRYYFSNTSADIRRIFTDACDLLAIRWTRANARNIAISRHADVEFLDTFVSAKS